MMTSRRYRYRVLTLIAATVGLLLYFLSLRAGAQQAPRQAVRVISEGELLTIPSYITRRGREIAAGNDAHRRLETIRWIARGAEKKCSSTQSLGAASGATGAIDAASSKSMTRAAAMLVLDRATRDRLIPLIHRLNPNISDALAADIALATATECRNHTWDEPFHGEGQYPVIPEIMIGLMARESDFNCGLHHRNRNGTVDHGLCQLNGTCVHGVQPNIARGCDELMWRLRAANGDYEKALAAYNTGTVCATGKAYAKRVLRASRGDR